jgi:hypothetical protein
MTLRFWIATLCVSWFAGVVPAQAQAVRSGSTAPTLRVLERSDAGVVFEATATWPTPLAEAGRAGNDPYSFALRAVRGDGTLSESVALPSLASPRVEILVSDYDEVPYAPPADAEVSFTGPAADVVHVGMERRQPTGTFLARMLQYDAERQTVRRYRRIVASVRFDAAAPARRMPGAAASRAGGSDNPHLAVGQSVLAAGTWFRVPVTKEGMYRIDRAFLSSLGLSPDAIDPDRVVVFGNGGAPLPALNSAPRIADLAENASFVVGGGDGAFNEGDAVYFYGAAPQGWTWDGEAAEDGEPGWRHYINLFSRQNVYFIRVDAPSAQRVGTPGFADQPGASVRAEVTGRTFREEDLPDGMIDRDGGGSGLDWMGAEVVPSRPTVVVLDTLPPGIAAGTVEYRARVATRSDNTVSLALRSGGQTLETLALSNGRVLAGDRVGVFEQDVAAGAALRVEMTLSGGGSSGQGWIDYVEAFYPQSLRADDGYLRFATPGGEAGLFEFALSGFAAEPQVWDVTEPQAIRRLGVRAADGAYRVQIDVAEPDRPREIVAFTTASPAIRRPAAGEAVPNQNLHAVGGFPDYVIVVAAPFREAADELAAYRAERGLQPLVVDVQQIYNEFSGGLVDMRAVRDYLRFLYDRGSGTDPALRYALLFGDGHFDFRGIRPNGDQNNWVPVYQTDNSFNRIESYTSDDYFGLLDDNEGVWSYSVSTANRERVDIGIGRLPVRLPSEAADMVDKIKRYESAATRGEWRTRYTFVADDQFPNSGDVDLHLQNADLVSDTVKANYPAMNVQKIYAMTYPRVQTALGARYPEAQRDIIRSFNEGTLVWNYSGHGGSSALADEKLLVKEDIMLLDNTDRLPIVITATCSFGRYDVVDEQSGAELFLLNAGGGAAGVFTTTRLVYTSSNPTSVNLGLNVALAKFLLARGEDGRPLRLGDVYRLTKNTSEGLQSNNRKFSFLGDPGMRIQLPERPVAITSINGEEVGRDDGANRLASATAQQEGGLAALAAAGEAPATFARNVRTGTTSEMRMLPELRALEEAVITGEVLGFDGLRDTGYNGEVEVAVFDAERTVLIPEEAIRYTNGRYEVRSDLIYRGRATVRDGAWTARFVVPRDISYSNDRGRVSAYVTDSGSEDGFGFTERFLIGGTAGNPVQDSEGPRVNLFMNDTTFVPGGLVGTTPVLIARLFDENGINTVGAGVGHELLLTVDGAEQQSIDVGRFYRGDLDSFRRGTVEFELPEQTPGPHTLTLRAWDVANNSASATLDYYVEPDGELVLRNVYNYPNPTTGPTRFLFEHNQPPGTVARVQLRIYTLSGRPVRTLDADETLLGGVLTGSVVDIPWDGRDEDFDTLATGIYLYKVRVEVERPDGEKQVSERIERLAVIR